MCLLYICWAFFILYCPLWTAQKNDYKYCIMKMAHRSLTLPALGSSRTVPPTNKFQFMFCKQYLLQSIYKCDTFLIQKVCCQTNEVISATAAYLAIFTASNCVNFFPHSIRQGTRYKLYQAYFSRNYKELLKTEA